MVFFNSKKKYNLYNFNMKETIHFFYNIDVDDIAEKDGKYHFKYQNRDFFFVYYNRLPDELDDILLCCQNLKAKGIDCHDIILNKDGKVLTKVANFDYILFAVSNSNEEYDIIDISENNKKLVLGSQNSRLYRNNWGALWSAKIDYIEYQIRELGSEKYTILESLSYYIGLAENAISYVNKVNENYHKSYYDKIVLSHRRIFYPNIKLNYLNPLSFIFDLEIRDIAEYLKALFFAESNIDALEELKLYLQANHLTSYSYQMLYARLLYPSYYFDIYEEIMNKEKEETALLPIICKVSEYEKFLKNAYLEIIKYAPLEKIDWLIDQY